MVNGSMIKLSSNESPTISFRIDGQKNRFVYNRPIETIKRKRIDDRWAVALTNPCFRSTKLVLASVFRGYKLTARRAVLVPRSFHL